MQLLPVFAPIGGFQAVTNAMEVLVKELGVNIYCNTTVTGVSNEGVFFKREVYSTNQSTDGGRSVSFLPADLVIVNADLPYAKRSLLINAGEENTVDSKKEATEHLEIYDWDDTFSFSSGVISFHWSLDISVDDLNTHNVFLMAQTRCEAEASWQILRSIDNDIEQSDDFDGPFNFYVHRPGCTDSSAVPRGYDSIMVLVPCKTLLRDEECASLPRDESIRRYKMQFSDSSISQVRHAVLKRMRKIDSLTGLEKHIIHEVVDTPATWADQFNVAAGTPFALVRQKDSCVSQILHFVALTQGFLFFAQRAMGLPS
jgi:phytoene desaturase (3,4-didehydrolycopene-forming)